MRRIILPLVLSLPACASPRPRVDLPISAAVTLKPDGRAVGTYVSSWKGFRTSSYWIEGPTGLILVDTQFLLSAGEEFVDWAEKVTGKKAVLALIPAVHELRTGWFFERFKPDYPAEQPTPESFGSADTTVEAAGLTLKLHVLGAGSGGAHVVPQWGDHVFVGDLVTIGFHSWLELGLLDEWLKRLDEIRALNPKYVHTGRGETGDATSVDREEDYLRGVIDVVKAHHPRKGRSLSVETRKKIVDEIRDRYPAYDFPLFLKVDALWKRMADYPEKFAG